VINITEFNYCPKCGEELVESAEFCHSCGVSLSELGNNTSSNDGSEQSSSIDGFEHIDEATMDSIDLDSPSPTEEDQWEKMEEIIGNVVEEAELTIDHITAEDIFKYIITKKTFERSARIKVEQAKQKSADISTIQEEMN
jgi:hypothetical protein